MMNDGLLRFVAVDVDAARPHTDMKTSEISNQTKSGAWASLHLTGTWSETSALRIQKQDPTDCPLGGALCGEQLKSAPFC